MVRFCTSFALSLLCILTAARANPFDQHVRGTEALEPEQQQRAFHLPPGFEIQLFAAEPDIAKPLNMAFDAKGRLWVTQSTAYPFAAKEGEQRRDAIRILEDTDGDGRADKFTTFADGLNIPIGVYPLPTGGAIAHSIPNIWHFIDRDDDDRADERIRLYGQIGFDDTHGMINALRRGFDGWLYACHGFRNRSTIRLPDGREVVLDSGNTVRMRLDGSDLQIYTHGQTNPFGLAFDGLGNLYSADCHSAPIYQLLRGGYYISLGKAHDGLGFAPEMLQHTHNSTGIAGIVYYEADHFPPEFRDNLFIGNVVTSRINRDSLRHAGSSPIGVEEPDFVTCDDPWFRPVDIVLGPDGALYVADFYNRIIGHYEVPLDHPGRDRERGRIWRIVYRGDGETANPRPPRRDWTTASVDELIEDLGHANLAVRMTAMHELVDRVGTGAIDATTAALADDASPVRQRHALWVLHRLGALRHEQLQRALASSDVAVRVHAVRVLADMSRWTDEQLACVFAALHDDDPLVRRCAIDALGQHPHARNIRPLLEHHHRIDPADTHLMYTSRVALRDHLKTRDVIAHLPADLTRDDLAALVDAAQAVQSPEAGAFLVRNIDLIAHDVEAVKRSMLLAVRHASAEELDPLVRIVSDRFAADLDLQLELFESIRDGLAQRGGQITPTIRQWGIGLASKVLAITDADENWQSLAVPGMVPTAPPWVLQRRASSDGDAGSMFVTSFPLGEQLTGVLRSRAFEVPPRMSFFIAGHNGYPRTNPPPRNVVRLREVNSDALLAEALPPRHDTAHPVQWDLSEHGGKQAYLEIIDADAGNGYAWLAVGRLDPPVVPLPTTSPGDVQRRQSAAVRIAGAFGATELAGPLRTLLGSASADPETRVSAARALLSISADAAAITAAADVLNDANQPLSLRQGMSAALGERDSPAAREALVSSFRTAPAALQTSAAQALAVTPNGGAALLDAVAANKAPPRVLLDTAVRERLMVTLPDASERIEQLTQGLTPAKEATAALIAERRAAFDPSSASTHRGAVVFATNCAACHRIGDQGGVVGPQLDGIGSRGLDRLLEDVLDPNRNLDPAFRYSTFVLGKGDVITGLPRREEGQALIVTDTLGRDVAVPKDQISRRIDSSASLMPDNFGELLSSQELDDLMAYLLSQRGN